MSEQNESGDSPKPQEQTPTAITTEPPAEAEGAPEDKTLLGGEGAGTPESDAAPEPFDPATFEFPETLEVSDEIKSELGTIAKEHKISASAMKALTELHAKTLESVSDRVNQTVKDAWNEQVGGWKTETVSAYGDGLDTVLQKCERVISEFGGEEIPKLLNATGLGNNLAMFKFLESIADAVGEAKPVTTNGEASRPKNPLEALYPSMVKKD